MCVCVCVCVCVLACAVHIYIYIYIYIYNAEIHIYNYFRHFIFTYIIKVSRASLRIDLRISRQSHIRNHTGITYYIKQNAFLQAQVWIAFFCLAYFIYKSI